MKKTIKKTAIETTKLSIYWLSFSLLLNGLWIEKNFGEPSFEQVLYHLQFGSDGLIQADSTLIKSYIKNCLIYPILPALIFYSYEKFITSVDSIGLKATAQNIFKFAKHLPLHTLMFIHKVSSLAFKIKIPLILILVSTIFLLTKIAFWTHLDNLRTTSFVVQNYIHPNNISSPNIKRNLVLIYVESLENTYSSKAIFQEDLLSSVNSKTLNAISFENFRQAGAIWTIAGIVSSQCGFPLKTVIQGGNELGQNVKQFLPGAICLGDILKDQGYKNIFMGGASLSFAGKGKFLSHHGYTELYGSEEWKKLGEKNFSGWGLYDDDLFKQAKKKISELEKQRAPYNLTMLTVDTHHPSGHISQTCKRKGVKDFVGIMKCTSDLLSDFVAFMSINGYLENTNLVIMGDHLAGGNPVDEKLILEDDRTIFNKFIVPKNLVKNRDQIYHFSIFPTILYSLGFRFENNRLALGASGFGDLDPNFKLDNFDHKEISRILSKHSSVYLKLWKTRD